MQRVKGLGDSVLPARTGKSFPLWILEDSESKTCMAITEMAMHCHVSKVSTSSTKCIVAHITGVRLPRTLTLSRRLIMEVVAHRGSPCVREMGASSASIKPDFQVIIGSLKTKEQPV